jgi:hypothetical protein
MPGPQGGISSTMTRLERAWDARRTATLRRRRYGTAVGGRARTRCTCLPDAWLWVKATASTCCAPGDQHPSAGRGVVNRRTLKHWPYERECVCVIFIAHARACTWPQWDRNATDAAASLRPKWTTRLRWPSTYEHVYEEAPAGAQSGTDCTNQFHALCGM